MQRSGPIPLRQRPLLHGTLKGADVIPGIAR